MWYISRFDFNEDLNVSALLETIDAQIPETPTIQGLIDTLDNILKQQRNAYYSQQHIRKIAKWLVCVVADEPPTSQAIRDSLNRLERAITQHERVTRALKTPEYMRANRLGRDYLQAQQTAQQFAYLSKRKDKQTAYYIRQIYGILYRQLGIDAQKNIMRQIIPYLNIDCYDNYLDDVLAPKFRKEMQEISKQASKNMKQQATKEAMRENKTICPTQETEADILQEIRKNISKLQIINSEMGGGLSYAIDEYLSHYGDLYSDQTERYDQ